MDNNNQKPWLTIIIVLIVIISVFHFSTPRVKWQYHLVYMQAYLIPIILSAFAFGIKGGLGAGLFISAIYFPHIILQHGGIVESNLMRFIQIVLFNVLGYLIGLKAQGERTEKERFQQTAEQLEKALLVQRQQSEMISDMEQQLRVSERLATIGELTASLAHEVRNPLGSIRGAVEIIRDSVPEEIKKLEFFDILIQDTERLSLVVENYLSFAKKHSAHIQKYDLQETIRRIILMLGARARKNNIKIENSFLKKAIIAEGDPTYLWQAMMNILLNAIQAMPDGGEISVSVDKQPTTESTTETTEENQPRSLEYVRITVRDQGPGMDEQKLNRIFHPFYTTRPEGTGLGLAIVKRLVEENQWKMDVQSEPGVGTEFALYVPVYSL